jgi:hypothetical protein
VERCYRWNWFFSIGVGESKWTQTFAELGAYKFGPPLPFTFTLCTGPWLYLSFLHWYFPESRHWSRPRDPPRVQRELSQSLFNPTKAFPKVPILAHPHLLWPSPRSAPQDLSPYSLPTLGHHFLVTSPFCLGLPSWESSPSLPSVEFILLHLHPGRSYSLASLLPVTAISSPVVLNHRWATIWPEKTCEI